MTVREAVPEDAPAIVELRAAYFESRNQPVQERPEATWWVAEDCSSVVAVQAYQDATPGVRTITDTYAKSSNRGRLGISRLLATAHERADAEGLMMVGMTEPDNVLSQRAMSNRGYNLVGYVYVRQCPS